MKLRVLPWIILLLSGCTSLKTKPLFRGDLIIPKDKLASFRELREGRAVAILAGQYVFFDANDSLKVLGNTLVLDGPRRHYFCPNPFEPAPPLDLAALDEFFILDDRTDALVDVSVNLAERSVLQCVQVQATPIMRVVP